MRAPRAKITGIYRKQIFTPTGRHAAKQQMGSIPRLLRGPRLLVAAAYVMVGPCKSLLIPRAVPARLPGATIVEACRSLLIPQHLTDLRRAPDLTMGLFRTSATTV
jgi:hypothetical protein